MDYGCNNSDQYRVPLFAIISRDSESFDRNVRRFSLYVLQTLNDWNTGAPIYGSVSSMQVRLTLKVCSRSEMIRRLADNRYWEVNSLFSRILLGFRFMYTIISFTELCIYSIYCSSAVYYGARDISKNSHDC